MLISFADVIKKDLSLRKESFNSHISGSSGYESLLVINFNREDDLSLTVITNSTKRLTCSYMIWIEDRLKII